MKDSFIITYDYKPEEGLDLTLLGESFAGFDSLIKDILDTAGLRDAVEIKATRLKQGSVEVYNALIILESSPFHDPQTFLEFLRIAAPELLKDANTFFSDIHGIHRSVNDYFAKNPLDLSLILLIVGYITGSMRASSRLKTSNRLPAGSKMSARQMSRLKKIVESGRYRKALTPITENTVSSIEIKPTYRKGRTVTFSESNVENYLPDEDKILPDMHNGDKMRLAGELLSLQSTKGELLKIKIDGIDSRYALLTCTPADGVSIESYKHLFKERVIIDAEVVRKTDYKRPELIIYSMTEDQTTLELSEGNQ